LREEAKGKDPRNQQGKQKEKKKERANKVEMPPIVGHNPERKGKNHEKQNKWGNASSKQSKEPERKKERE
jgi:hypothetical protein